VCNETDWGELVQGCCLAAIAAFDGHLWQVPIEQLPSSKVDARIVDGQGRDTQAISEGMTIMMNQM
jgi:hypothetical protein